ncbi:MAG: helix-turn-helix domain-containing protein [Rhodospirillales bacterium]|nr:helix-turn-helix domain-containing protein [Rhodospirillales bacterium]
MATKLEESRRLQMSSSKQIYGFVAVLKLLQIAAYDDNLPNAAIRIFNIIAGHADEDGTCYPSISRISERMGITRQAVINQLRTLEKNGYMQSTGRSHPETGGTLSNIYLLNLDMAREFQKEPDIFCKRNANAIFRYLVTLFSYTPRNPIDLHSGVTSSDYPKKPKIQETNNKKPSPSKLSKKQSRTIQKANNWQREKEREKQTGVSKKEEIALQTHMDKLEQYMNAKQRCAFDIELNKSIREQGISGMDAIHFMHKKIDEKLSSFEQQ